MPVGNLITLPCKILRHAPAADDEYGNDTDTVVEVETVCYLNQRQVNEPAEYGEVTSESWRIYLLPGEQIGNRDEIEVGGRVYELDGAPYPVTNPSTGQPSHIQVEVKIVEAA